MKRYSSLIMLLAMLLSMACNNSKNNGQPQKAEAHDSLTHTLEGDSTIYGLACDGCTDTILMFLELSRIDADPDTFNVLKASRRHRIFGRLRVGDRIAIVRNPIDSTVADFVIDMEELLGSWCYQAMPTLRQRADMTGMSQKQMLSHMSDSLKKIVMTPRELGVQLQGDNTARPIGAHAPMQEDSPVDYPIAKRYRQWRLYNGKLLLTAMALDSLGNSYPTDTDTADFVLLQRDSLVLRFKDMTRGYYRKN